MYICFVDFYVIICECVSMLMVMVIKLVYMYVCNKFIVKMASLWYNKKIKNI